MKLRRQIHRLHLTTDLRQQGIMLKLKCDYKQLIRVKKSEFQHKFCSGLKIAATTKNATQFWHIVAGKVRETKSVPDISISATTWENYYTNLFKEDRAERTFCRQLSAPDINYLPPWPPISASEKKLLIQSLKNGKNFLPPELFKTDIDWWAIFMAGLFTQINNTECVPKGWKLSIIIPIHKKGDKKLLRTIDPSTWLSSQQKFMQNTSCKKEDWALLAVWRRNGI